MLRHDVNCRETQTWKKSRRETRHGWSKKLQKRGIRERDAFDLKGGGRASLLSHLENGSLGREIQRDWRSVWLDLLWMLTVGI